MDNTNKDFPKQGESNPQLEKKDAGTVRLEVIRDDVVWVAVRPTAPLPPVLSLSRFLQMRFKQNAVSIQTLGDIMYAQLPRTVARDAVSRSDIKTLSFHLVPGTTYVVGAAFPTHFAPCSWVPCRAVDEASLCTIHRPLHQIVLCARHPPVSVTPSVATSQSSKIRPARGTAFMLPPTT